MLGNEMSMICVFRRYSKHVTEEKEKKNGIIWTQEGIFLLLAGSNSFNVHTELFQTELYFIFACCSWKLLPRVKTT